MPVREATWSGSRTVTIASWAKLGPCEKGVAGRPAASRQSSRHIRQPLTERESAMATATARWAGGRRESR